MAPGLRHRGSCLQIGMGGGRQAICASRRHALREQCQGQLLFSRPTRTPRTTRSTDAERAWGPYARISDTSDWQHVNTDPSGATLPFSPFSTDPSETMETNKTVTSRSGSPDTSEGWYTGGVATDSSASNHQELHGTVTSGSGSPDPLVKAATLVRVSLSMHRRATIDARVVPLGNCPQRSIGRHCSSAVGESSQHPFPSGRWDQASRRGIQEGSSDRFLRLREYATAS